MKYYDVEFWPGDVVRVSVEDYEDSYYALHKALRIDGWKWKPLYCLGPPSQHGAGRKEK